MKRRNNILNPNFKRFLQLLFLLIFFTSAANAQQKTKPSTQKAKSSKSLAYAKKAKGKSKKSTATKDLASLNIIKRAPASIFRKNETIIEPKYLKILDSIANYMLLNPTVNMEIGVHTDARWEDDGNNFTEQRAKVIVDYLEYKGVSRIRLKWKGYGKSQPLVTEVAIKRMKTEQLKESAHLKNRRIEFKKIN